MSENIDTTISLLTQFGISEIEAKVYLAILGGRGDTALSLSRHLKLARTKVYRILDNLLAYKLIVTRVGERGMRFVATPIDQLDFLISDRQYQLNQLKASLPTLQSNLVQLAQQSTDSSRVLYYHGIDGLKQISYNSLRAKGELLTFEVGTLDSFFSHAEAEKLRARFVANKIHIRTLTNATHIDPWTNVREMVQDWSIRYLDPRSNPFQFEILIYNNVYCMYRYTGNDVFCVEIYSAELANMQRQLFEYLWQVAKPLKIIDDHGTAVLT